MLEDRIQAKPKRSVKSLDIHKQQLEGSTVRPRLESQGKMALRRKSTVCFDLLNGQKYKGIHFFSLGTLK